MENRYETYTKITKELLDSISVGDLVKVNDWNKPLRVKGVSKDYFVMATKEFGKTIYSVCEKKPWEGIRYNAMIGGKFHVGTDGWLFGSPVWNGKGYDFDNELMTKKYLETFELPKTDKEYSFLSSRSAIPILQLFIKRTGGKSK